MNKRALETTVYGYWVTESQMNWEKLHLSLVRHHRGPINAEVFTIRVAASGPDVFTHIRMEEVLESIAENKGNMSCQESIVWKPGKYRPTHSRISYISGTRPRLYLTLCARLIHALYASKCHAEGRLDMRLENIVFEYIQVKNANIN